MLILCVGLLHIIRMDGRQNYFFVITAARLFYTVREDDLPSYEAATDINYLPSYQSCIQIEMSNNQNYLHATNMNPENSPDLDSIDLRIYMMFFCVFILLGIAVFVIILPLVFGPHGGFWAPVVYLFVFIVFVIIVSCVSYNLRCSK